MNIKLLNNNFKLSTSQIIMNLVLILGTIILVIYGIITSQPFLREDLLSSVLNKTLRFMYTMFWLILIQQVGSKIKIYLPMMIGFTIFFWGQVVDLLEDFYELVFLLGNYENLFMNLGLGIAGIGVFYWLRDMDKKEVNLLTINKKLEGKIVEKEAAEKKLTNLLREKEILNKEIHHRVKNNLAVISSLLDLHSSRTDNTDTRMNLLTSRNRVHSMALIHEQLYQSKDLAHISFKSFIERLINELIFVYDKTETQFSLETDLENVNININVAVPCGLIVNELITNSMKHAFPEHNDKNQIVVQLNQTDDKKFKICVKDNGIGFPKDFLNGNESLGLRIVNILTKQIQGEISIENNNGSKIMVIVPNE